MLNCLRIGIRIVFSPLFVPLIVLAWALFPGHKDEALKSALRDWFSGK